MSWPARAPSWRLAPLGPPPPGGRADRGPRGGEVRQPGPLGRVGLPPRGVVAGVEELGEALDALAGCEVLEGLERKRRPAGPAGRRAGQDEPANHARPGHGQLLGHHAPEGDPEHEGPVPAEGAEEPGGVGGVVGHRPGPGRDRALSLATLVVGGDLEGGTEGAVDPGDDPQVPARPRDDQEPGPGPVDLVVELDGGSPAGRPHRAAGHRRLPSPLARHGPPRIGRRELGCSHRTSPTGPPGPAADARDGSVGPRSRRPALGTFGHVEGTTPTLPAGTAQR